MIQRATSVDADEVFLDLEDSCAPSEKGSARAAVIDALARLEFRAPTVAVRVNGLTTEWSERDIVEIATATAGRLHAIVVPKVERGDHVARVEELLTGVEDRLGAPLALELELQIESARGALRLAEIASAGARTAALVFGPGDYAASLGIPQAQIGVSDSRYAGHQWHWIMSHIAVHAKAEGAQAIDGPVADFTNEDSFRESALQARLLGYDGKWCIHPNQVPWANDVFSPSPEELQAAHRIVAAYDDATARGDGAIAVDGSMVDEASRRIAEATIARAAAAGARSS